MKLLHLFIVSLFLRLSASIYVKETLIVSRYLFLSDILYDILTFLYKYPPKRGILGWLMVYVHSFDCNTEQILEIKRLLEPSLSSSLDEELMLRTMLQNS